MNLETKRRGKVIDESDVLTVDYIGVSKITPKMIVTFNWKSARYQVKQWIARITGPCPRYGLKKTFLDAEFAAIKGNKSPHAQMLTAKKYDLEPGWIYQYENIMECYLTRKYQSGFFICLKYGIVPIEYDQVRVYLNMPIKKGKIVGMPSFKPLSGDFCPDDVPF